MKKKLGLFVFFLHFISVNIYSDVIEVKMTPTHSRCALNHKLKFVFDEVFNRLTHSKVVDLNKDNIKAFFLFRFFKVNNSEFLNVYLYSHFPYFSVEADSVFVLSIKKMNYFKINGYRLIVMSEHDNIYYKHSFIRQVYASYYMNKKFKRWSYFNTLVLATYKLNHDTIERYKFVETLKYDCEEYLKIIDDTIKIN